MPIQKCPMCLETKNVVSSHLHPAALYDYCRAADNTSPTRIGDGVIMHTDRQIQRPLLCVECENLLSKGGETWTNPKLATTQKSFPLYDILTKLPAAFNDQAGSIYDASENPEIEVERLTHFAIGIFWKASVHSWRGSKTAAMIDLGAYSDRLRRWLRGEDKFPNNVCLEVVLARPERALIVLGEPTSVKREGWSCFLLGVPGILFILDVGLLIDADTRMLCFHENPAHPVLVSDEVMGVLYGCIAEQFRESRKTRAYLAAKTKRSGSLITG